MSWQQILINIAITLAAALLTALGSWVLVKVKNLVATKIKNTKTQALLLGAVDVVASVVKATYQTYVQAIKGTEAWTQEAQKNALQQALHNAQVQLSTEAKDYIQANFGDVGAWVQNQIEATLYDLKNKQ
ncbi:hypothetical protein [Pumilibacter muris]|uniref:hypothetical protein n=1 Tax=Pumilibacter muris TaxID=2941510 RepID=UPI00203C2A8C|nr:hypothetical protein [Pumilibacter muris]